jgi:hypothetical protein
LVAFKQLVPEHTVAIAKGIIKIRVKVGHDLSRLGPTGLLTASTALSGPVRPIPSHLPLHLLQPHDRLPRHLRLPHIMDLPAILQGHVCRPVRCPARVTARRRFGDLRFCILLSRATPPTHRGRVRCHL